MKRLTALTLLTLTGCSTGYNYLTIDKDGWYEQHNHYYWMGMGDDKLYYCRANPNDKGTATPLCFQPAYINPGDPKPSELKTPQAGAPKAAAQGDK